MSHPTLRPHPALLRRKCACGGTPGPGGECESCRRKRLGVQRSAAASAAAPGLAPPIVHDVLASPGRPLDAATRAFMEPRFGHDFGRVRVHDDARAGESARAVSAVAYTVGRSIVFGAGAYAPATGEGRRLVAHELAHVVQQGGVADAPRGLAVDAADSAAEREAEHAGGRVASGGAVAVRATPSGGRLSRACVNGTWKWEYDGCSAPLGDNPAGADDTSFADETSRNGPCDRHDRCYQTCGSDKAACDARMYRDMVVVCQSSAHPEVRQPCLQYAGIYYAGLVAFGAPFYLQRQVQTCGCALSGGKRGDSGDGAAGRTGSRVKTRRVTRPTVKQGAPQHKTPEDTVTPSKPQGIPVPIKG